MGKIIVLDPGHGLNHLGKYSRPLMDCTGNEAVVVENSMYPNKNDNNTEKYYREDLGTLRIALDAMSYLIEAGHTVFTTRVDRNNAGIYLASLSSNEWKKKHWKSWKWIKETTKKVNADIFVSIHTNAGGGTGCSAFYADAINGRSLSESITGELNKQLGLKIRRIKQHRYLILRDTCKGRACLVECLFHDNINDVKLLLSQDGVQKVAKALADGIDKETKSF